MLFPPDLIFLIVYQGLNSPVNRLFLIISWGTPCRCISSPLKSHILKHCRSNITSLIISFTLMHFSASWFSFTYSIFSFPSLFSQSKSLLRQSFIIIPQEALYGLIVFYFLYVSYPHVGCRKNQYDYAGRYHEFAILAPCNLIPVF